MTWTKDRTRTLMVRTTTDMTSCKSWQRREQEREREREETSPAPTLPTSHHHHLHFLVDLPCPVNINTSPLTASQSVSQLAGLLTSQPVSQSISGVVGPFRQPHLQPCNFWSDWSCPIWGDSVEQRTTSTGDLNAFSAKLHISCMPCIF